MIVDPYSIISYKISFIHIQNYSTDACELALGSYFVRMLDCSFIKKSYRKICTRSSEMHTIWAVSILSNTILMKLYYTIPLNPYILELSTRWIDTEQLPQLYCSEQSFDTLHVKRQSSNKHLHTEWIQVHSSHSGGRIAIQTYQHFTPDAPAQIQVWLCG